METMSWLAQYISPAVMTFIGAILSLIGGLLPSNDQARTKKLLQSLIISGALLSAIGAWWASNEQDRGNRLLDEKTNKIVELSEKLVAKSDEISELNNKLVEKSDELAATFHGADSFVQLWPTFTRRHSVTGDLVEISLLNDGRYPVYDIQIRVVDLRKWRQISAENQKLNRDLTLEQIAQTDFHYSFLNNPSLQRIDAHRMLSRLDMWQLPKDADQQDYNVWILARNGEVVQQIRFRRINGEWRCQTRVTRGDSVLYDSTEKGTDYLPRNEAGEVQWE
jgi:hypothetical protein